MLPSARSAKTGRTNAPARFPSALRCFLACHRDEGPLGCELCSDRSARCMPDWILLNRWLGYGTPAADSARTSPHAPCLRLERGPRPSNKGRTPPASSVQAIEARRWRIPKLPLEPSCTRRLARGTKKLPVRCFLSSSLSITDPRHSFHLTLARATMLRTFLLPALLAAPTLAGQTVQGIDVHFLLGLPTLDAPPGTPIIFDSNTTQPSVPDAHVERRDLTERARLTCSAGCVQFAASAVPLKCTQLTRSA